MTTNVGSIATLVAAVAVGRPLTEAASEANMSVRTAQRRLHEPEVAFAINEARVELTRQAVGELTALRDLAFRRLRDVLSGDHEVPQVLRAAELVFRHMAAADVLSLRENVLALEATVTILRAQMNPGPGSHDE
jgi:hypothetical protein